MKKSLKSEQVLMAYNIISTAKYGKLDDADKIKVWKIARAMKPVATRLREDSEDAAQKMKPTEDFDERLQRAQEYERLIRLQDTDATTLPMGAAEYDAFIKEFNDYRKLVDDTIKEFSEKEVSLDFEPLSEEAFGKLMASNNWTMDQVIILGDIICQ